MSQLPSMPSRRQFLRTALLGAGLAAVPGLSACSWYDWSAKHSSSDGTI